MNICKVLIEIATEMQPRSNWFAASREAVRQSGESGYNDDQVESFTPEAKFSVKHIMSPPQYSFSRDMESFGRTEGL